MTNSLDMKESKLRQLISEKTLVRGLWDTLASYCIIPYTEENHKLLVDIVQSILGCDNIEMEWTEDQYNNFVKFDPNLLN
jgi:hypothetical protein